MALPVPPVNPNDRIPNNPFYYPEGAYLYGPTGPLIVGSGFSINNVTGTINVSGGGSGAPTILAGAGISVVSGVGTVTIANTGIRTVTAGAGIGVTVSGGNLNIVNTLPAPSSFGTVTAVTAGTGLTGGTITTSGTIALATTAVAPGTYSNPTITVDSYGRITFASPGGSFGGGITATGPIAVTSTFPQNVSIQAASTSASGAVRLNDTVTSTSTTQAATANAVKVTYDVASQAQADATNAANSAAVAFAQASSAQALASTANANSATALSTALSAQNDATNALAAASAAQNDATTALATANTANTTANSALTVANNRIPCAAFTGLGQLLVGTGSATFTTFNPGVNGRILAANSACASGLEWVPQSSGGVTSIFTGVGLIGGPINTTGTIALANTTVIPGTYTNSTITVDAQGRLTSASSGTTPVTTVSGTAPIVVTGTTAPIVSITAASTTACGAVQLYDDVNSTSTSLALTAAQGKALQDQISALAVASNLTYAGTFDAAASDMLTVSTDGGSAGFTVGSDLPAPVVGNTDYFVIVTTGGSYSPPGGGGPYNASQGDWFLSNGTTWDYLNVGADPAYATTTSAGVVCLATNALAQAGTDSTTALTPSAAASAYIPKSCITAKGALISGTAASTPTALTVGTDGQVLVACSTATTGLCWVSAPVVLDATPIVSGKVLGCTDSTNAALGCNAFLAGGGSNNVAIGLDSQRVSTASDNISMGVATLKANTAGFQNVAVGHIAMCSLTGSNANQNVAMGSSALCAMTSGLSNDAIGALSMLQFTSGCYNVSVGGYSLFSYTSGNFNTAIGHRALTNATTGCCNTALGGYAGDNITTGCGNVIIGPNVQVANGTANNQLAIGYNGANNWLTGDSNRHIRPGAGIRDCTGSLGTSGQVLTTTGAAIQWVTPAKQYVSAWKTANQTVAAGATVQWDVINASGIAPIFGSFILTVGKTYSIVASLAGDGTGGNATWYQWKNNSGLFGPTLSMASELNRSGGGSMSLIYSPTTGNEGVQLVLASTNTHTLLNIGNSITIVEL